MIGLLQRVTSASVTINDVSVGEINQGLMVLIGIEQRDDEKKACRLIEKILSYRVFSDQEGKMNFSLKTINGGLLLVPQFTLAANTKKGTRPSFSEAASPQIAETLFNYCVHTAIGRHEHVSQGKFGADMRVSLINDGPVTFWLQT